MKTISKDEYEALRRNGFASVVDDLNSRTVELFRRGNMDWEGYYWAMWHVPGEGTVLGPVNVTFDVVKDGE